MNLVKKRPLRQRLFLSDQTAQHSQAFCSISAMKFFTYSENEFKTAYHLMLYIYITPFRTNWLEQCSLRIKELYMQNVKKILIHKKTPLSFQQRCFDLLTAIYTANSNIFWIAPKYNILP